MLFKSADSQNINSEIELPKSEITLPYCPAILGNERFSGGRASNFL